MILHRIYDGTFDMSWALGHRFLDISSLLYLKTGKLLSSREIPKFLGIEPESDLHSGISGARHEYTVLKKVLEK